MKGRSEGPSLALFSGSITAKNGGSIMAIIDRFGDVKKEVFACNVITRILFGFNKFKEKYFTI